MGNNNGVFQSMSGIRYNVCATRLSGESMTSGGNTIVNKIVQQYVYMKREVAALAIPTGDDSATGLSAHIPIAQLEHDFQQFGLKIEAKYVSFDKLGYLSSRILHSSDGYQLVRDPIKAITKFPWCTDKRRLHKKQLA